MKQPVLPFLFLFFKQLIIFCGKVPKKGQPRKRRLKSFTYKRVYKKSLQIRKTSGKTEGKRNLQRNVLLFYELCNSSFAENFEDKREKWSKNLPKHNFSCIRKQ